MGWRLDGWSEVDAESGGRCRLAGAKGARTDWVGGSAAVGVWGTTMIASRFPKGSTSILKGRPWNSVSYGYAPV